MQRKLKTNNNITKEEKVKSKKGISLIVLVITIIVMIILAATIILAINNNNVVDKAKDAVAETNYKQVQELAQVAWADGYVSGKKTQAELDAYVREALTKNGISEAEQAKYTITVTTSGVNVEPKDGGKADSVNEYGFYFDRMYTMQINSNYTMGVVLHRDGSAEMYAMGNVADIGDVCELMEYYPAGYATYSKNKILFDGETATANEQEIGLSETEKATISDIKVHGIYRGYTYSATVEGEGKYTLTLDANNNLKIYLDGVLKVDETVASVANDGVLTVDGNPVVFVTAADGTKVGILEKELILTIEGTPNGEATPAVPFAGAVITPVVGSSVENIKAGNPQIGDKIEYNGYEYRCNQVNFLNQWTSPDVDDGERWWSAKVKDNTKTSYVPMESVIAGNPVTRLWNTFEGCTNLTETPILSAKAESLVMTFANCTSFNPYEGYHLPESVTYMLGTFSGCTSLINAPVIPENVDYMEDTFMGCTALVTAPIIPSKVTNVIRLFQGCTSLTGTVTINSTNIQYYEKCFLNTTLAIELAGNCPAAMRTTLAGTSTANNVTVAQ